MSCCGARACAGQLVTNYAVLDMLGGQHHKAETPTRGKPIRRCHLQGQNCSFERYTTLGLNDLLAAVYEWWLKVLVHELQLSQMLYTMTC